LRESDADMHGLCSVRRHTSFNFVIVPWLALLSLLLCCDVLGRSCDVLHCVSKKRHWCSTL